jgi:CDP-glucose 4,6-dehydratase
MLKVLKDSYHNRRVLITGHTGFKGSWLTAWLKQMGAQVTGIALDPGPGTDNIFENAGLTELCSSDHRVDICDEKTVQHIFSDTQPEIVFHLAAQALVRPAYEQPLETFRTNILGTAHVLEAARQTPSVAATVCVTTDKVYDNKEWFWPYREEDRLGGIDPYSASKSGAEMVALAYMQTLPPPDSRVYNLATARGGNVVGGGDWSSDRIVPDIIRSIRDGKSLVIRNPAAVRPWQHVLELCYGYLSLGHRLLNGWEERDQSAAQFSGSWNFGPAASNEITVAELISIMKETWGVPSLHVEHQPSTLHESTHLRLDCSKARALLAWQGLLGPTETFAWTAAWYREFLATPSSARHVTLQQIATFEALIENRTIND